MSTQTISPAEELESVTQESPRPHYAETKRPGFHSKQPERTLSGSPIEPVRTGLPKFTQSLCPDCTSLVEARLFEEDGKVWMEKTCPEHGYFRDLYYGDVKLYRKMENWHFGDGVGLANPAVTDATRCPSQCGRNRRRYSFTPPHNVRFIIQQ